MMSSITYEFNGRIAENIMPSGFFGIVNFLDPSQPWFNFDRYPIKEFIPFAIGCFFWVIVYAIYIKDTWKLKRAEMPLIAAASNLAWEILWGFFFRVDMGKLIQIGYAVWCVLDLYIFYGLYRYGDWQIENQRLRKYYRSMVVLLFAFWLVVYFFFISEGHDTPIGANSAYVAQFLISVGYLYHIWRDSLKRFRASVLWLRTLGSTLTTVFMFMHYWDGSHGFLLTLAGLAALLDFGCICLYLGKQKEVSLVVPQPGLALAK